MPHCRDAATSRLLVRTEGSWTCKLARTETTRSSLGKPRSESATAADLRSEAEGSLDGQHELDDDRPLTQADNALRIERPAIAQPYLDESERLRDAGDAAPAELLEAHDTGWPFGKAPKSNLWFTPTAATSPE